MNTSRLKKVLQKRWRRWKRRIGTIGICALLSMLAWTGIRLHEEINHLLSSKSPIAVETLQHIQQFTSVESDPKGSALWEQLNKTDQKRQVHLRKVYVCGEEEQDLGVLRPDEIYALLNQNPYWSGSLDERGEVWLEETLSDLSPMCKEQGYMGIDKNGNLSLFDGAPKEENVMKTFFQLDISSMESSLPEGVLEQLYNGIRIQDIHEYNSVLSTFSDYARDYTENVMKVTE